MKINPIGSYVPSYYENRVKNSSQNKIEETKSDSKYSSMPFYENISFEGKRKDRQDYKNLREMVNSFTPESEDVYELGKTIAKQTGSRELETWHLYLASLYTLQQYIKNLDEGVETYDETGRKKLPVATEGLVSPNYAIFSNEKRRKKAGKVINSHIKLQYFQMKKEGKKQEKLLILILNQHLQHLVKKKAGRRNFPNLCLLWEFHPLKIQ